jgi:hypothetical protein
MKESGNGLRSRGCCKNEWEMGRWGDGVKETLDTIKNAVELRFNSVIHRGLKKGQGN